VTLLAEHVHDLFAGWGVGMWVLFGVEVAVTVWVLWRCVRLTLDPREDGFDHVKRSILREEDDVIVLALTSNPRGAADGARRSIRNGSGPLGAQGDRGVTS
jgi:hypothetical protein